MADYDVARICLNGHVVNPFTKLMPEVGGSFCEDCGEKTSTQCVNCGREIQGAYQGAVALNFPAPNFCRNCGKPYPWTERRLAAARELIDLEQSLAQEEKEALERDVEDIARNAPRAQGAAIRAKKLLSRVGGQVGSALRDIFVDVASEAVKQILLGP